VPLEAVSDDMSDVLDSTRAGGLLIRGGALRFASYAAGLGLSVLSVALLTRHLGVGRFGEYVTVLSLVGIVSAVTDAGMATLGTREFAIRRGAERDELMRDLLSLRISLTMFGIVLVTAFGLAAGYDTALLIGAMLAALATIALVVQHTHTIPIAAALRLGTLSALDLARQVLTVASIVVLVALGAGVLPLLAVALAVNLALIPPTAALARHQISLRLTFPPRHWRALLLPSIAYSLATAVGTLYVYTAQILTSLVASSHQSGLFAASFRVFIVLAAVPGVVVGGAVPLLSRAARDDRVRLVYAVQRIFDVTLIVGVAAALGSLGGAQFVIEVVAGGKYSGAAEVLQIQGGALIASFAMASWTYALLALGRNRGLLLANFAAFVVSCSLTLALANAHGATGAAVASVCGESTLALGCLLTLVRGNSEFRPALGFVSRVALAAAPAVVIALLPDIASILRAALALALYGLLLALMRAIPSELVELLPARLRGRLPGARG
jgi:O-antigen/teichoic acid export membrane protein